MYSSTYFYYFCLYLIQAIKDWMLVLMVGIVVTIDIAIVLIGTAIPRSRLEAARIRDREHQSSISVSHTNHFYTGCSDICLTILSLRMMEL